MSGSSPDLPFLNTALHLAVWRARVEVVRALLDRGADAGARNILAISPEHAAKLLGDPAVVRQFETRRRPR